MRLKRDMPDQLRIVVTLEFPHGYVNEDPKRAEIVKKGAEAAVLDAAVDNANRAGRVRAIWESDAS